MLSLSYLLLKYITPAILQKTVKQLQVVWSVIFF